MKVTNVSAARLYLKDLQFVPQSQTEGRRGENQYLEPGQSAYLIDTSEVLRSALKGDLARHVADGKVTLNDQVTLNAGASLDVVHGFGFLPTVTVVKQVGLSWVDATGTYNLTHDANFTTATVQNATAGALTFIIKVS